jgi:putative PIN family toxin of toxin-antitoxin system
VKPRVVFDCMLYLQAAAKPSGPAGACIDRSEAGDVELLVSAEVMAETRDVINRPDIQKKFRTLTPQRATDLIARVERVAVVIDPVPEAFTLTRDPKDSKYLNLAIAGGAELVVSRDHDLLDLMTSADAEAAAFRAAYPGIRIVDPVAFLRALQPPAGPPPTTTP